jgi:hypothetical protein
MNDSQNDEAPLGASASSSKPKKEKGKDALRRVRRDWAIFVAGVVLFYGSLLLGVYLLAN